MKRETIFHHVRKVWWNKTTAKWNRFRTTFLIDHKMLMVKCRRDGNLAITNCGLIIKCYWLLWLINLFTLTVIIKTFLNVFFSV